MATKPDAPATYVPRFPTLVALALLTVWIVLLFIPAFGGKFLVGPNSDQIWTGVPFRWFGAEEWRRTGHIPLWNPYMFGGLPFVGAMHGDIFYPTAWLRLALPVDVALNLGFAAHLVLAGLFTYLFLRSLDVSWTGAVTGGMAYQLSGILASLVQPGHDGKLYVSALMPLLMLGLVLGVRRGRLEGYGIVALAALLGLLSPHLQMMQYTLILAGLFTLYLAFWADERPAPGRRWPALGLALAAVVLGFAAAAIQLYPFVKYMPYAARSAGAQGWQYATSWAMPPANIVDWLVPEFTGITNDYWGENAAKLHSEYLGAAVLVFAAVGVGDARRRRLLWFLGGAFALFLLVALGGHTPFYRLWYAIVPGVKVTRAAGMAFFIPAFVTSTLAAIGVDRIQRGEGRALLLGALLAAGALLMVGASGALAAAAESLARRFGRDAIAAQSAGTITFGAVRSAVVVALAAGLGLVLLKRRLSGIAAALVLALVVGGDLFYNARRFYTWSPPARRLYQNDELTRRLESTPKPYRALDFAEPNGVYPRAFLMAKLVPNVLGHHGNEMHRYDELLGGKNVWQNLGRQQLWSLLAVRYLLLGVPLRVSGYHIVTTTAATSVSGTEGFVYEADTIPPYARVVTAAAKVPDDRMVPTLLDPRFGYDRILLLPEDAPVQLQALDSLPPRTASSATVTSWEPGAMTVRMDPAPSRDAWLLVSENWYPDWHATVDGREAPVLRGDYTFIALRLPRGAREVRLAFSSPSYRRGRAVSLASVAGILAWLLVPPALRRRRG